MKRREFSKGILGIYAMTFTSRSKAKSVETPYEEPFEGYNVHVERLKQHIGEEVRVQDSFNLIRFGRKQLLGLERFDDSDNELFPHGVSFDDGSTHNLRNIASITECDVLQIDINPEEDSTFI
jgi:hypothetical protein|tara:strand:+ start:474 stop:842 length:369 start_codon:yes stop_codon:yes gene_type:complete